MGDIKKEIFVCLDCETTGLDLEKDRIIEVAAVRFTFSSLISSYETLIDPECEIPEASSAIHHIFRHQLEGKPKIKEILPTLLGEIGPYPIVGHGVAFDIEMITRAAQRADIACDIRDRLFIDTLRLARLYGESPTNSLEMLAKHFNVAIVDTHRAMADVLMNIDVFKHLTTKFRTTEELMKTLSGPIRMKVMPLGKYKGRAFTEIPLDYLEWSARMSFDQDLLYSIRSELKRRREGGLFTQATNPFTQLK